MAEKLMSKFAKENFGTSKYIPALHGRGSSIQPSTLLIKRKRVWWKKPFHHSEMIVLSKLEKYINESHKKFYTEIAESYLTKSEKKLQKKEVNEVVKKHDLYLKPTDNAKIECSSYCTMGDVELGTLDEEYYEDTDLRDLLDNAILSKEKMSHYTNYKMYIVTGVIYSSMFKIIGKRESLFNINGQISVDSSKLGGWLARVGSLRGGCATLRCKAAMLTRKKKAPLLFTVSPVEYDEKNKKLKLPENVCVGNVIPRGRCDLGKKDDKINDLVDVIEEEKEEEENLFSELIEIENLEEKLKATENLLLSVKTKDERMALIVKYLYMLETLLSGKGQKLYLESCYQPEIHEKDFLEQVGLCFDGSTVSAAGDNLLQDVQDYGLILQIIAGRNENELDELHMILNEGEVDEKDTYQKNIPEKTKKVQEEKEAIVC